MLLFFNVFWNHKRTTDVVIPRVETHTYNAGGGGNAMKKFRQRNIFFWLGIIPLIAAAWIGCSEENTITNPVDGTEPPPTDVDLETVAPATVDQLVVRSPGVRSLALQWIAPGADGWDGIATQYDIRFATAPITEAEWDQASTIAKTPTPDRGLRVQKCRATGLEPATTYYFAMKVMDGHSNESTLSNMASGTTLQEHQPPTEIRDLEVSESSPGEYLLTWTASGDDGVLGTATTYDVRYMRFGVITNGTWRGATSAGYDGTPKPPGEPESLLVSVDFPEWNHSFGIKVGDEVTNWSGVSNPTMGLGTNSFLWSYPEFVAQGEELIISFRAPGDEYVQVEVFYSVGLCGTGNAVLFEGMPEAGIYTVKYDFYDMDSREYLDPNWYQVSVCIAGERRQMNRVQFTQ
jgi:hypothetical protein